MEKKSFWKRAFSSVKGALTRPVGKKEMELPIMEESEEPVFVPPLVEDQPTKRQVLGQEFDVVEEGLAEEQVTEIIGTLTSKCRALDEQQRHFLSLGSLTERAAIEADKAAASIKARAKGEAEAESARIIAEADTRIQEMMTEARKAAEDATRQEVHNVLQAGVKKAALIEVQAKQQAQAFLIRSREAIEGDLREEVKETYYRLLSGVHNVLGEGNKLELGWREKTGELRNIDTFELDGTDATSGLAADTLRTPALVQGEGRIATDLPWNDSSWKV